MSGAERVDPDIELTGEGPPPDEETGTDKTVMDNLWEELNIIEDKDLPLPTDEFQPVPPEMTADDLKKLDDDARKRAEAVKMMQQAKKLPTDKTPAKARQVIDSRPGPATPADKSRVSGNVFAQFKRNVTEAKKKFFREKLGVLILKGSGKNSKLLYEKTDLVVGSISEESGVTSIKFKNVEIATIDSSGAVKYNNTREAGLFKEVLKKAATEAGGSLESQTIEMAEIEKNPNLGRSGITTTDTDPVPQHVIDSDIPQEVIDEIIDEVFNDLEAERERIIRDLRTELRRVTDRNADLEDRIREAIVEANNLKDSIVDKEENIGIQSAEIVALDSAIDNLRLENKVLTDNSIAKITQLREKITSLTTKNKTLTTTKDNLASDLKDLREEVRKRKKGVTEKGVLSEKELSDLEAIFDDNEKEGRDDQLRSIAYINDIIEKEGTETFDENLKGRLKGIDVNIKSLKDKADESDNGSPRQTILRLAERAAEMTKDYLNARYGRKVESEEGEAIVRDAVASSPRLRFERFKEWAKENLGALAAVAISIGGIITTIVVGARSALKKGASALGKLGSALWNAAGKVALVFGALLGLAAQIISLGAKGLAFLANNLWILVVAITYYLYEQWKEKKWERRQKIKKQD